VILQILDKNASPHIMKMIFNFAQGAYLEAVSQTMECHEI
jgi:hypothetical protein